VIGSLGNETLPADEPTGRSSGHDIPQFQRRHRALRLRDELDVLGDDNGCLFCFALGHWVNAIRQLLPGGISTLTGIDK